MGKLMIVRATRFALAVSIFFAIFSYCLSASADDGGCCSNGVFVSVQGANTLLEHAADQVNQQALPTLHQYVPSAPAFNLNRPEYTYTLGYEHRFNSHLTLDPYIGFSYSPDKQIYNYTGDGNYNGLPIGPVQVTMNDRGQMGVIGADLFLQTGGRNAWVRLVFGGGFAVTGYQGDLYAVGNPLLVGSAYAQSLSGRYWGVAGYGEALTGVRFDFFHHSSLSLLGGYRAGLGYINMNSTVWNGESALPIYGPEVRANLGVYF